MIPLEQEIHEYLKAADIEFRDYGSRFNRMDFELIGSGGVRFYLDAKEKRTRYKLKNWIKVNIPEKFLFIIDELAVRKALWKGPNSGIVVRDNIRGNYYFFPLIDLVLMPKHRVNRPVKKNVSFYKGKWLIDLRNGKKCQGLEDVISQINEYVINQTYIFEEEKAVYGSYFGEDVPVSGTLRQKRHWKEDYKSTRPTNYSHSTN